MSFSSCELARAQARINEVKQKLSDTTDERKFDPITRKFLQVPGITCIMALKDRQVGHDIHRILSADPFYTEYVLLLPPESYHCTISGLEHLLLSDTESHRLCKPLSDIAPIIAAYQHEVERQFFSGGIKMKPGRGHVSVCTLTAATDDDSTEKQLRSTENLLYTMLTNGTMTKPYHPQIWDMTIGYVVKKPESRDVLCDLEKRLTRAVDLAIKQQPRKVTTLLEFEKPKVCTYKSMERFDPIFESSSCELASTVQAEIADGSKKNRLTRRLTDYCKFDPMTCKKQKVCPTDKTTEGPEPTVVSSSRDLVTAQARIDKVKQTLACTADKRKFDPKTRKYLQVPGITCVMALKDWQIGREIHRILSADPFYNEYVLLLPPESYHCTLSPLEHLTLVDNESGAKKLCRPLSDIAPIIAAYQDEVDKQFSGVIKMRPGRCYVSGWALDTVDDSTEGKLRIAENGLYTMLTGGRMTKSYHPQQWHMTIGYYVKKPENNDVYFDLEKRMTRAVESAMKKREPQQQQEATTTPAVLLEFDKPKVCTYESMERFDPIF